MPFLVSRINSSKAEFWCYFLRQDHSKFERMKYSYVVLLAILLSQCAEPKVNQIESTGVLSTDSENFIREYYDNTDQLKFEGERKNGKSHGFCRTYTQKGDLKSEGQFENGKPNGFCKFYYPGGKLKIEAHYNVGLLNGYYKSYYQNGHVKEEGHFLNGKKTGYWKSYNKSGKVLEEGEV